MSTKLLNRRRNECDRVVGIDGFDRAIRDM